MDLKNNKTLYISTGRSRYEKNWANKEIEWSSLVNKLSKAHRTAETYNEYIKSKRSRQDEIKDIGGFVGGYVANGKRKKGNITFRSMVCLDLDYAEADVFEDYKLLHGYAACMYSTHKHSDAKPRLRLVIPLADTVTADKYEPISRKIAEWIGIEQFDDTTYQAERLMYWPSTAKDAPYYFDYCDGEFLDGEEVLKEYYDWKDVSNWPISSRVDKVLARAIKKQEDPHEKKGLVGAFCKAFTITEAIELFLQEEYTACDVNGRYTYTKGSTTAGVVIYDDTFAFSHHSTDPCSMKLCNAFDLVRIHKFGHLDEKVKENTPTNRYPSFVKMVDFVSNNEKAKSVITKERIAMAANDFDGVDVDDILDDDWVGGLGCNSNGDIRSTIDNAMTILKLDPNIAGAIAYNEFVKTTTVMRDLPWRKVTKSTAYFTDTDASGYRHYLEKIYRLTGAKKIEDAISLITRENSYHPVKDYLDSLRWDGKKRLDTVFIDYLGAEDNDYIRAVTRKALTACVARIKNPGCKFDNVLTLVGKQGVGKSTILAKLGMEWYNENVTLFNISKETADLIQGSWLIELGELVGFKKAEAETVKNFISRTEDRYRKAYGRNTDIFPRQCVFFGTTNENLFLKDPTGNRRWWPVETGQRKPKLSVFEDLAQDVVDQIWAEAIEVHKKGEVLYLRDKMYDEALKVQETHNEQNEKVGLIEKFLATEIPHNWDSLDIYEKREYLNRSESDKRWEDCELVERKKVCVAAIWCELFNGDIKQLRRLDAAEIMNCIRSIDGWKESKNPLRFKEYGRQKGFMKDKNADN